jgi:hypothetical protein
MTATTLSRLPATSQPSRVGRWPATVPTGGGELWDSVLEYRVRAPGTTHAKLHAFATHAAAEAFAAAHPAASPIVALVRQANWFLPDATGRLARHRGERLSEWDPTDLAGRFGTRQAIEKLVAGKPLTA